MVLPNCNFHKVFIILLTKDNKTAEIIEKEIPLSINSILLRGCVLRNTEWVIGIVVGTGYDTKIIKNSGKTPSKQSRIDKQMNPMVILLIKRY